MSDILGIGNWEDPSLALEDKSRIAGRENCANVQCPMSNFNCVSRHGLIGHSVETAAQKRYTVALFGTCCKLRWRNRKLVWVPKG